MAEKLDPIGPAPETASPRFLRLLFGACAAPLAWLGQMVLGYGITAYICYPADHPVKPVADTALFAAVIAVDGIALALCAAGAWVSWSYWRRGLVGRNRMLALWGLMSSLWFFVAILFNAIASFVPPCLS
jgi:hypothetical protein